MRLQTVIAAKGNVIGILFFMKEQEKQHDITRDKGLSWEAETAHSITRPYLLRLLYCVECIIVPPAEMWTLFRVLSLFIRKYFNAHGVTAETSVSFFYDNNQLGPSFYYTVGRVIYEQ
jgi:hypothetical protein